MALRGRPPKFDESGNSTANAQNGRRRKHWIDAEYPGTLDEPAGPPLPDDREWCAEVVELWETIRTTPTADGLLASDWQSLRLAAFHMNRIYTDPSLSASQQASLSKEATRILSESLPWSATDRRRLGVRIANPDADDHGQHPQPQRQGNIADHYRRRLDPSYVAEGGDVA